MIIVDLEYAIEETSESSFSTDLEAADLMKLIEELPVGYRTVFNLYAIEGYNHIEIGEMLGISEGTSKSQLSRARAMLQAKLIKLENKAFG
jgi:RNA polymerase sigma factor (sigma-70 family)